MSRNKDAAGRNRLALEIERAGSGVPPSQPLNARPAAELSQGPPSTPAYQVVGPVDIVDRLQSTAGAQGLMHEAAAEILRLRADVTEIQRRLDVSEEWSAMWRRSIRQTNPEFDPEQSK